jgi:nitroreductase / dihydropteridine reductase
VRYTTDMHTHNWLHWRYATKKFDTSKALPAEDLEYILAAGNLAATSYGLQPFNIIVVTDEAKKQALMGHAYNQLQVGENAALIVLAARTDVDATFIATYTARIESERGLPAGAIDGYKDMMTGHLTSLSAETRLVWAQKQAYIALGTMMVAAAEKQVDSCPMEGFDPAKFDEVLGLAAMNLHATIVLPIGYRSSTDETAQYKKVRRTLADIVVRM